MDGRRQGDEKLWRALGHPLRQRILGALGSQGGTATSVAKALGESSGSTSYHLRVLAAAGVVEVDPERSTGRDKWWHVPQATVVEPDYDTLDAAGRAALDDLRALQIPRESALFQRFLREHRDHGPLARALRARLELDAETAQRFFDDLLAVVQRYDAPPAPGTTTVEARIFFLPADGQ